MVNYNFQTKENLIHRAVQIYISAVVTGSTEEEMDSQPGTASDHMRLNLKQAADFIAGHQGISRVSILRDLQEGISGDNTSQVEVMLVQQPESAHQNRCGSPSLKIRARVQVAAVQHLFLRAAIIRQNLGLDFFTKEQHHLLMDMVIDTLAGEDTAEFGTPERE